VFQTVSLNDTLRFEKGEDLRLTCSVPHLPVDESNLILKAAEMIRERLKIRSGAWIHLEKFIPSPGGLGGGSSNAAVALIGLARLWEVEIGSASMQSICESLGSDVPFFFHGGTAVGLGRGEEILPLRDLRVPFLLVVTPEIAVPTGPAFERLHAATLTNEARDRILPVCRSEAESLDPYGCELKNDFEESVFDAFPEVHRVKETLLGLGAVNAAMSGSGASVFAVFDNLETRQAAIKALDHESTWRKFAVATVSRNEYREALGL
jgi:4-diphosphocytidyl-2-C-methyl-D-erythritol kinase